MQDSLQNLKKQRNDLKRRLNNIDRKIKKHPGHRLNDENFIKEFQQEIKALPSLSGSRYPAIGRLTKEHGKMLSNKFVERSKRHPEIRDVLHRIQNTATNREIDMIIRQTLVRLKRTRKKNEELMSNALITRLLRDMKKSSQKNERRKSIPNNLRHVHAPSLSFSPVKTQKKNERRKSIPNDLRHVHAPSLSFSPVKTQRKELESNYLLDDLMDFDPALFNDINFKNLV